MSESNGYAVHWLLQSNRWSHWHWSNDGKVTLCGQHVRSSGEDLGLVEKAEGADVVDRARCTVKRARVMVPGL